MQFGLIVLNAMFLSNIVTGVGSGVIGFQSDKKNLLYMTISCVTTILSVILGGLVVFALQSYVLVPLKVEYLKMVITVLIALIMAYLSRIITKYISRQSFYLYERSYQFATQTIILVAIMLLMNLSVSFMEALVVLAGYCAGYLMVQILMFALHEKLDNRYNFKPSRSIPILLYTLCILGIILSAVGIMF